MFEFGFTPQLLDIGGGFERGTFNELSKMVNFALEKYFPLEYTTNHGIKFIAEPGRFMVANAFTLITHVIARRDLAENENDVKAMLYINDGVYGNLNCILFDHQNPKVYVLTYKNQLYYKQKLLEKSQNQKDLIIQYGVQHVMDWIVLVHLFNYPKTLKLEIGYF